MCLVDLDHVIIISHNVNYHIKQVDEILTTLADADVTRKIYKSPFLNEKLNIWVTWLIQANSK